MSLADDFRAADPTLEVVGTWDEFVGLSAPFRAGLTRTTGWYHHDEQGRTTAEPATNPDDYKSAWWPRDDTAALVRRTNGAVVGISVYSRVSPTEAANTIRFGERAPAGVMTPILRALGLKKLTAIVKDVQVKQKLVENCDVHKLKFKADWDDKKKQYNCEWTL